ncbi:hypothetical protein ACHAPG_010201 [Botrytis cinerea]
MLYHWVNDTFFDTNDSNEAILSIVINGTLEDNFRLDVTAKAKPVAGPDDLLLLLVQHWARDKSIFPTEDDRHDINDKSDIEDADDSEYDKLDNDRDCREPDSSYGTHRADIAMADDTSECRIIKVSGSGESVP